MGRTNLGRKRFLFIPLLLCLAPSFLFAQQQDRDRPPTEPQPQPPERVPPPDRQPGRTPEMRERPFRFFVLTGEVVLEDGNPLQEPVVVELRCGGRVERQTHTTIRGGFSFRFDDHAQTEWADASVGMPGFGGFGRSGGLQDDGWGSRPGGDMTLDLSACDITAAVPGFRSNTLSPGIRRALDNPDVGTIVLSRIENVGGTTISLTTLAAPRRAKSRYERALRELGGSKPNLDRVDRDLNEAVKEFPEFAAAWKLLADVRLRQEDETGARRAYEEAIEADSNYVTPYLALAEMELRAGHWPEVSRLSGRILELNAELPEAHFLHALSSHNLGKPDLAESSVRKIRSGPGIERFPQTYYLLALILSERGEYALAADELQLFLEAVPDSPMAAQIREVMLQWEGAGLIPAEGEQPEEH
jgi:hypothetical protein